MDEVKVINKMDGREKSCRLLNHKQSKCGLFKPHHHTSHCCHTPHCYTLTLSPQKTHNKHHILSLTTHHCSQLLNDDPVSCPLTSDIQAYHTWTTGRRHPIQHYKIGSQFIGMAVHDHNGIASRGRHFEGLRPMPPD